MKIALFGTNKRRFYSVYTPEALEKLSSFGELSPIINKRNLEENKELLKDCEVAFSTWGMPQFTKEEIKKYLPSLKAVFYSAGTVQYFARPFLESGIKVFSAYAANAIPVTEYTVSLITLASKGFFQSAKSYRLNLPYSYLHANSATGNFRSKIGLAGLGAIGKEVAKKLQPLDNEVMAYDPFVSEEEAGKLGVKLVSLETLFSECDVISNHLADKKELKNIFNFSLFKRMKKHSVFINTGRGAQVKEADLTLSLILHPSRTFVGDVIKREYFPCISPLFWCPNAVLTPHIAGSTGNEPQRMAYYMINELELYLNGKETKYEITLSALDKMA